MIPFFIRLSFPEFVLILTLVCNLLMEMGIDLGFLMSSPDLAILEQTTDVIHLSFLSTDDLYIQQFILT